MRSYIAEFLGTFALVFCGTGAIIINEFSNGAITHVGIAITFGLVVMAMIYTFGDYSGCHINPAVTLAFAFQKVFPSQKVLPYLLSQFSGAIAASAVLKFLFPTSVLLGATLPAGSDMQTLVLEFILSFFLMLCIINVSSGAKEKGLFTGLAVGSVILLEAMFAGPVSGASMNPARSFAPALISGHLSSVWIYFLAPISGTCAAVGVHRLMK
jgi:aquaporin NIP